MNKEKFLKSLKKELSCLPRREREEHLLFYKEMIDDRLEEGLTEEQAILSIGFPVEIASQILANRTTIAAEEKISSKRKLKKVEIFLLILGAPLWISLLFAMGAILLSFFVVIGALLLTAWVVTLPFLTMGYMGKYLFLFSKKFSHIAWMLTKKTFQFLKGFMGQSEAKK